MAIQESSVRMMERMKEEHAAALQAAILALFPAGWLVLKYDGENTSSSSKMCTMFNTADSERLLVYVAGGHLHTALINVEGEVTE